jgi:ABC-type uncharacterized transport system substrate-binding protein
MVLAEEPSMRVVCLLFLLCAPLPLHSHPHVFIDCSVSAVFDQNGLAGFKLSWVFDKVFSAAIILDFDGNGDSNFDAEEIDAVKEGAFANLKNYDYFCHVTVEGAAFRVQYVRDFSVVIRQQRIIYTFFVPCHVPATGQYKTVTVGVYDETYFTDISYDQESLGRAEKAEPFDLDFEMTENRGKAYWGGQIIPKELRLRYRMRQ